MIVALVISLVLNVLLLGFAFYLNNSWYHDVIKLIETSNEEYSKLNNMWCDFCNKQVETAVNSTAAAIEEVYNAES